MEKYDKEKYTPPFRVGRNKGRAVLDSKGILVIVFENSETQAQLYCDYLNTNTHKGIYLSGGLNDYATTLPFDRWVLKKPEIEGVVIGETCNRNGCKGILLEHDTDTSCSCHINPPCSHCVDDRAYCPACEWEGSEDQILYKSLKQPAVMEDKGLSIEEKKKQFEFLSNPEYMKVFSEIIHVTNKVNAEYSGNFNHLSVIKQVADKLGCAPLFHTTIDDKPIWAGESYYSWDGTYILHSMAPALTESPTGSSTEIVREWIQDNRMVKVSNIEQAAKNYFQDNFKPEFAHTHVRLFLEELSKLSN